MVVKKEPSCESQKQDHEIVVHTQSQVKEEKSVHGHDGITLFVQKPDLPKKEEKKEESPKP